MNTSIIIMIISVVTLIATTMAIAFDIEKIKNREREQMLFEENTTKLWQQMTCHSPAPENFGITSQQALLAMENFHKLLQGNWDNQWCLYCETFFKDLNEEDQNKSYCAKCGAPKNGEEYICQIQPRD